MPKKMLSAFLDCHLTLVSGILQCVMVQVTTATETRKDGRIDLARALHAQPSQNT